MTSTDAMDATGRHIHERIGARTTCSLRTCVNPKLLHEMTEAERAALRAGVTTRTARGCGAFDVDRLLAAAREAVGAVRRDTEAWRAFGAAIAAARTARGRDRWRLPTPARPRRTCPPSQAELFRLLDRLVPLVNRVRAERLAAAR